MVKTHLAPGFRFHPTDVELVKYYLKRKVTRKKLRVEAIAEIDIYKFEPSDLPDKSYLKTGDLKWYFFCPRGKKYASGVRKNRTTGFGYWKITGKDRAVLCNNEIVGIIKTLVYHCGKSPRGERTDWVMHEYRLEDKELAQMDVAQDAYVLCVLFKKDGPGPRNGAQYGAPFKEEEWSDGEEDEEEDTDNVASALPSVNVPGPCKETSLIATSSQSHVRKDFGVGMISESCVSDMVPTVNMPLPPNGADNTPRPSSPLLDFNSSRTLTVATQNPGDDDIYPMLGFFVDDESFGFGGYSLNEARHESGVPRDGELPRCLEVDDVFSGLPELNSFYQVPGVAPHGNPYEDIQLFLELGDLAEPLTVPVAQSENLGDSESICLVQDEFGFFADPSCFEMLSGQSQSQPTQPFSGNSK
ncbi:PREDICTED: NAC domain-containing protein 82-like [Tarenaya hassleriana]|uniref:NAC domain-containing protein 82-like n=1 Tax=Tarenaya hassleriana TaxID=28532 RepID=UPI00053C5FC9|nr:PREDICTED: NAC domain-containing protein 82-like [Tarenaya hassleriana]